MVGEFIRGRARSRGRGNLRTGLKESSDESKEKTTKTQNNQNISIKKLSFQHEEEDVINIRKKRIFEHKSTVSEKEQIFQHKNSITTKGDTIFDKLDSSFSIKINPIPKIEISTISNDTNSNPNLILNKLEDTPIYASESTVIPNAAAIFAAKKKRQNHRSTTIDVIPIETSQNQEDSDDNRRLVREGEGYSSEDEEFAESSSNRWIMQQSEGAEESQDEEDSDDEEIYRWELQQMNKGGGMPSTGKISLYGPILPSFLTPDSILSSLNTGFQCNISSISFQKIVSKIKHKKHQLDSILVQQTVEINQLKTQIENENKEIEKEENFAVSLKPAFEFYQFMSGYIVDMIDCFNEILPQIVELETKVVEIYKKISLESKHSIQHQITHINDLINSYIDNETCGNQNIQQIDEMISKISQNTHLLSNLQQTKLQDVHNETLSLINDIQPQFYDLKIILEHFDKWRSKFSDSYTQAYIGAYLNKLLTPIVRLHSLQWSPFQNDPTLSLLDWFHDLVLYSIDSEENETSPDILIIPRVLESVICPKINSFVEVWDCLSQQQTMNLVNILTYISQNSPIVGDETPNLHLICAHVYIRLQRHVSDFYLPLYPVRLLENEESGATRFVTHRIKDAIAFVKNCLCFSDLLNFDKLKHLVVDEFINKVVVVALSQLPHLFIALELCQHLSSVIPTGWFPSTSNAQERTLPLFVYLTRKALIDLTQQTSDVNDLGKIEDAVSLATSILCKLTQN